MLQYSNQSTASACVNFSSLIILFILTAAGFSTTENEASFPRHPSPSPDGSLIAFSYAGDIWTVPIQGGNATRLTVHPAYEHNPKWSPDGDWIAYSSGREGNDDVYVIPSGGGQSRRLTWYDTNDEVCSWTADNRSILFSSRRDDRYPDHRMIYKVSLAGGTPFPVMDAFGSQASISVDGRFMLYMRDGTAWWRKHYRGSDAGQVWMYDLETGTHIPVTDTSTDQTGDDFRFPPSSDPLWGPGGAVYIISQRDGTANLWKRESGQSWKQVTFYEDDGVRFPSISADCMTITYEQGMSVYTITGDGEPQMLNIIAALDASDSEPERIQYDSDAVRAAFSPRSDKMFVEVRGEIFCGRVVEKENEAARGQAASISLNNPARDGDFTVSPGGDSLVFVSDRKGSRDLYLAYSNDNRTTDLSRARSLVIESLTETVSEDHSPAWSPDERYVAFVRGKGDLFVFDLKKKREIQLLTGWSLLQFDWSPDGNWIAFAREDNEYNSDVFILQVDELLKSPSKDCTDFSSLAVNVSRHPDEDEFPVWSADGKKLGFRSRRRSNNWDIYFVFLSLEEHQKSAADRAEERIAKPKSKSERLNKNNGKEEDGSEDPANVIVDTLDIYRRVMPVIELPGEEGIFDISPDGGKFAFATDYSQKRDVYIVDWDGENLERLTRNGADPAWISFSPDGKEVRFIDKRGFVKSVKIEGSKAGDYPFEAVIMVDRKAERFQKFGEVWRGLKEGFYDPEFHGMDWKSLYEKYVRLVPSAPTEEDFGDIVTMLMGELNSSHMGYNSPDPKNRHSTGKLGLDFDRNDDGEGLLVQHVLPYGPCDRKKVHLKPGDRLVALNGNIIGKNTNIHQFLDHQVDKDVEITVRSGRKTSDYIVQPMGNWYHGWLRYSEWVKDRRAIVDALSAGKLGYVHIRGMGDPSLARFESQLFSVANDRDGLVIDVRNNTGGWITDYLLAILQVKRHAITFPRDGGPGYPQSRLPLYSWVKPIIVLCNQGSVSNAEIFSHSIKTLKRGKLVGVPTPGAVISTSWEPLIDGSEYRVPLRGWYIGDKPERDPLRNMEGNGAVPDIIVTLAPGQIAPGDDAQLIAAVEALLCEPVK